MKKKKADGRNLMPYAIRFVVISKINLSMQKALSLDNSAILFPEAA